MWKNRLLYALLCVLLMGCSTQPSARPRSWGREAGGIKVLSTVAMIDDLVALVGGGHVQQRCLIANELDPHSYELVKGDAELLSGADLVFYGGLGLEHGPSLVGQLVRHPNAASVGHYLQELRPERIIQVGGQPDPHVWTDVGLWAESVTLIAQQLEQADPIHALDYRINGQRLKQQLEQLDREIASSLAQIPAEQRYLISSHGAFYYFVRAYLATEAERQNGCWIARCAAPEGLAPEAEMSLSDIARVVDYALEHRVTALFPESNVNPEPLRKIADVLHRRGLAVTIASEPLYGDAMAVGSSYIEMAQHNARVVQQALGAAR